MKADKHSVKVSERTYSVNYSFLNGFSMYMRCMR